MLKSLLLGAIVALTPAPALAKQSPVPLLPWKYDMPTATATVIDPGQPPRIALPVKKAEVVRPPLSACGEIGRWTVFLPTSGCSGMELVVLRRF